MISLLILAIIIIAIIITIFYFNCDFKEGDLIIFKEEKEEWESDDFTVLKILKVGKNNYQVQYVKDHSDYMIGVTATKNKSTTNMVYSKYIGSSK